MRDLKFPRTCATEPMTCNLIFRSLSWCPIGGNVTGEVSLSNNYCGLQLPHTLYDRRWNGVINGPRPSQSDCATRGSEAAKKMKRHERDVPWICNFSLPKESNQYALCPRRLER